MFQQFWKMVRKTLGGILPNTCSKLQLPTSNVGSLCLGCGIPSQNPLLRPERKSLHCFGYQPGYRWWKSFSKRIHFMLSYPPLSAWFHVFRGVWTSGHRLSKLTASYVVSLSQAPVVISRDHHDVSGTDSPFRETSNVYDGSAFCAGMCTSLWLCTTKDFSN